MSSFRPDSLASTVDVAPQVFAEPTRVRYGVLAFSATMAILLYLDRYALSVAQTTIRDELRLDDRLMGIAQSAFFWTYALAQVPAGWLSQRFGPRLTLALYVAAWSVAFGGMGLITGLGSLVVFRGLLGLAQAGAYPCAGGFIKHWFPVQNRGVANSVTSMGGRGGGLLSTVLTPQLMWVVGMTLGITTGQWRWVFVLYAVAGLLWAVVFWLWFRDTPGEHPSCNVEEQRLIAGDGPPPAPASHKSSELPPLLTMALHPTVVLTCVIGIFLNVGWIFLVTFLPTYLKDIHHLDLRLVGWLAAAPGLASMFGGVLGGITTDRLVRRIGLTWGRRVPGVIANGGAATAYALCFLTDDFRIQVGLFAAAGFLIDFGLGSLWAVYQDIGGKHVSAVLGFANMCGNLSAAGFLVGIGSLAKANQWTTVFAFACGALLITMICWCFVNPRRMLIEDVATQKLSQV